MDRATGDPQTPSGQTSAPVTSDCIKGFPGSDKRNLESIKDYGDYASKMWAGVLALLLSLIGLKK
jgi:hypothetical protein